MARAKLIQSDYDDCILADGVEVEKAYCLTEGQARAIRGMLEQWGWETRWYSPTAQPLDMDAIEAFAADLSLRLIDPAYQTDCGEGQMEFRQDPNNACQLQYRHAGEVNWTLMFDYSLCQPSQLEFNLVLSRLTSVVNNQYTTIYDGTPGSINPQSPTWFMDTAPDSARKIALCMASKTFVDGVMFDALNRKRVALGLIALGTGVFTWLTGSLWIVLGGGTAVLVAGAELSQLEAAHADETARQAMACKLFEMLQGKKVDLTNFVVACQSLGYVNAHEETISQVIYEAGRYQENFLMFVDILGKHYDEALAGVDTCACDEDADNCGLLLDFRNGRPPGVDILTGVVTVGEGLVATYDTNGYKYNCVVHFDPPCQWDRVDYLINRSSAGGNSIQWRWRISGEANFSSWASRSTPQSGDYSETGIAGPDYLVDAMEISCWGIAVYNFTNILRTIKFYHS